MTNETPDAAVHVEQPMPTRNDRPSIQSLVRADLEAREQVGIQRYGTPLQAFNGRDGLRDAYEEALDLATYLRQVIEELRSVGICGNRFPAPAGRSNQACTLPSGHDGWHGAGCASWTDGASEVTP